MTTRDRDSPGDYEKQVGHVQCKDHSSGAEKASAHLKEV